MNYGHMKRIHARHQSVTNILASSPRPLTCKEIQRRLLGKLTANEAESSLRALVLAGVVEVAAYGHGGHTSNTYRVAVSEEMETG